jgi:hypothetical protein
MSAGSGNERDGGRTRRPLDHAPALAIILALLLWARGAPAAEHHGTISIDDYFIDASGSESDYNFLTTRLRLDSTGLNGSGTLSFHFDGREKLELGPNDYESASGPERIDTARLDYSGRGVQASFGRLTPKDFYIERVDGVNVVYKKDKTGGGFFGGLKPDPYSGSFNSSYTTAGGYVFHNAKGFNGALGFVHNAYKGAVDRQYIYGQANYTPRETVMAYATATADINQETSEPALTNGIIEVSYRPDFRRGVTVGYNQFRAVRLWESMTEEIDTGLQQAYYISGNHRVLERYNVYGRVEGKTMHYVTTDVGIEDATVVSTGVGADDLFKSGVDANLSASFTDGYGSRYATYRLDLGRMVRGVLQLQAYGSYTEAEYDLGDPDSTVGWGGSGHLRLDKKWGIYLSVDREDGDYSSTTSVFSRLSYKF